MDSFKKRVTTVQAVLKAPKNQYNSFGKYHYRSCEDILEAAKPMCCDNGLLLTISDEMQCIGDRYYIRATATLTDTESGESISNTAYAREPAEKKGMDESQITGTASSYARKYALNGLFCIDDTKDADTDEYTHQQNRAKPKAQAQTKPQLICRSCGAVVTDYKKQDGTVTPADKVYSGCGQMCMSCYMANKAKGDK